MDTHKHGMQLLHSTDAMKTAIGLSTGKVKTILERLFRKGGNPKKKLLALNTAEFYTFVINNEHLLRDEFCRNITARACSVSRSRTSLNMIRALKMKSSIFLTPMKDISPATLLLLSAVHLNSF